MNTARTRDLIAALMLSLLCGSAAAAPLSAAPEKWDRNPLLWRFRDGVLHASGAGAGMAVYVGAPASSRVTIEADVTVGKAVAKEWKTAGVAVYLDEQNFWHFAMVEAPEIGSAPRRHFFELSEMRNGEWLAQRNLKLVVDERTKGTWQTGKTYRLRISLDPKGVEGSLTDTDGRVLVRRRYAFSAAAVTSGRPALRCSGFEADFAKVGAEHSEPVAEAKATFPPYRCASFVKDLAGRKTGVFHVEQRGETWWVIDPLGRGFVPLGVDHVLYRGHWCETLGYAPHGRKNNKKYASREQWAAETLGRLKAWGFNMLAGGTEPLLLRRGLAHTKMIQIGGRLGGMGDAYDITPHEGRPCSAFPNVFHPDFERYCFYRARQVCKPLAGDPWLFGYFLDNELAWWGRGGLDTGLFDAVMKKSASHTAKIALKDFLSKRYDGDVVKFNGAWGAAIASFDDVLTRKALTGQGAAAPADKKAFLALIAETYFGTIARAIRAVDGGHMILGCRFAGGRASDVVWAAAGRHCEVLTFNYYGNVDLDRGLARDHTDARAGAPLGEAFAEFHRRGGRPMMITEWSFPALDSSLPCTKGAGQRFRTQAERARATEIYARTILGIPFMLGFDYFMWVDEPALGISSTFPENTNYGLINEDSVPYKPIVEAFQRVNADAAKLRRAGPQKPPAATRDAKPPTAPEGTQLLLWNRTKRTVPASTVWVPTVPDATAKKARTLAAFQDGQWRDVPTQFLPRPKGSHAAVVRIGPVPPGQAVFLRSGSGKLDATPNPALKFKREGKSYRASNGPFVIKGSARGPGLTTEVWHDGVVLGRYNALVHHWTDRNHWTEDMRRIDVSQAAGPLCLTLDLTGQRDVRPGDGAGEFQIAHRLILLPESDWFIAELLWCRNTGDSPLNIRSLFFRAHGAIGGQPAGDVAIGQDGVPRLWGRAPGDAWVDEKAGVFWGLTTDDTGAMKIRFWLDDGGRQHPDARHELTKTLAPGEAYYPPQPLYVIGVAGRGGRKQWEARVQKVLDLLSLSTHAK